MYPVRKASLVALYVAGAMSAGQAIASPDFYGKLSLSVDHSRDAAGDSFWRLDNQASRLGLKGDYQLDEGAKLVYQYEVGIEPADTSKPVLGLRNSFLGIEGKYGRLIGGNFDTPLKQIQGKVDVFNDTRLDMTTYLAGEVRHDQSVQYSSPTLPGGVTINVDWMPAKVVADDDGISASVALKQGQFYGALAIDEKVNGDGGVVTNKANPLSVIRAVAAFDITKNVKWGVLIQQAEGVDADKSREKGWLSSVSWKLDRLTVNAQIGQGKASQLASGATSSATMERLAVGMDYSLNKTVTAFSYLGTTKNKDGAGGTALGVSRNDPSLGFGLRADF